MEIASLGSGSKGNATLVRNLDTTLLIDCGFSLKKLLNKLDKVNVAPQQINAVLVTHEHSDHISGVEALAKTFHIPIYTTLGTSKKFSLAMDAAHMTFVHGGQSFKINGIEITAVTVPHDCNEPVQFVFQCMTSKKRLGVLTDTGHVSSHMLEAYSGLDALLIEFNYDEDMLANGPYPFALKKRVGGLYGHLSNQQSIDFVNQINHIGLKKLIVGHISEKNNVPEKIETLFKQNEHLISPILATQHEGFDWQTCC